MKPTLTDLAIIIGPLLILGAILKNAFPAFPNRLIPLLTWLLGTVGYCLSIGSWTGASLFQGILLSATATGIHSGLKNSLLNNTHMPDTPATPPPQP